MRTIKFRGRRTSDRKWIYGDLKKLEPFGFFIHGYDGEFCLNFGVDTETVGQFTGLYDKNGNEIYEGDILQFGNIPGDVCEVKWNETLCAFGVRFYCENEFDKRTLGEWLKREIYVRIIGNIHDNPEILKGGEK